VVSRRISSDKSLSGVTSLTLPKKGFIKKY